MTNPVIELTIEPKLIPMPVVEARLMRNPRPLFLNQRVHKLINDWNSRKGMRVSNHEEIIETHCRNQKPDKFEKSYQLEESYKPKLKNRVWETPNRKFSCLSVKLLLALPYQPN
jgi:hypothetical protein